MGALIIGDSVKYSLQQITIERLGNTDAVITAGERLFTCQLAENISKNSNMKTSAVLRANGIAIVDGGQIRVNQLQVWGIDSLFASFSNVSGQFNLSGNEVLINENLAFIMQIKAGDEFLLRVNKLSTFPANTPFVAAEETSISFRVKIKGIVGAKETGNFNLQNIQSAPRNVFINAEWLNSQLGLKDKANAILLAGDAENSNINSLLKSSWTTDDLNLKIRENKELGYSEIISERVFISQETENACLQNIPGASSVFSYFVNQFQLHGKETPYSFISTLTEGVSENEIIINEWLASDLNAKKGDTILVQYFEVGPLRRLIERDTMFVVTQIVPMKGAWADVNRMPEIPGLSDAGHCRDWEAGVPVDLNKVRETDEEYWNLYKGTPKAFVSLETAQKLWGNRFGKTTAIRFPLQDKDKLAQQVASVLQPEEMGFQFQQVKAEGLVAASNGVDFGGLFIGLSFFVLAAAILLSILMFKLFLGFRREEIGTLTVLGFSIRQVQKIFIAEASVLVFAGIIIGIPFSIAYNKLILQAVNSIWVDIVRTSIVYIHIRIGSVILGTSAIFVLSLLLIFFITKSFLKQEVVSLQKQVQKIQKAPRRAGKWLGIVLVVASVFMVFGAGLSKGEINPELFFISGFGLLPGLILVFNYLFFRIGQPSATSGFSLKSFLLKRVAANRRQNTMIVSFLSIGIFLVVSTGVNRKNLTKDADRNFSGTGGYSLFAETTIPVPEDLNDAKVAENFGFDANTQFVQFRVKPGDDASCLNLNRIARPRIIGFDPEVFDQRKSFTFLVKSDDLNVENPWNSLNKPTAQGYIPAIADQTVIVWGLGKNVGDTLVYISENGEKLKLQLIGGLANSVFQGNVLIAEKYFNENYPSVSGSNLFLIDSKSETGELETTIKNNLRNYGVDVVPAAQRLLEFYKIENTYLNIFLMLGALGLLIGTIGLGIIIFRMVSERSNEYAVLLALGFQKRTIYRLVFTENLLIILVALFAGLIPSVVSAIPSATTEIYQNLLWWPFIISMLVFVSAFIWMTLSIRLAMRKNLVSLLRND
ncbi:MAG: hypothetical protein A2W90_03285 [Bacteroidetes bacterium GWF2_42_66]|nr:MAG: hypothetical protein A2W92_10685 [Bacteroidetes bacterium GWA2_42_15]OFY01359.1 MAG: hypothetical protein A2W89_16770 [Bacteroidetes bacterium GWE2_42_39]OFY42203.1 MAG: hypothetical protein A2W90_03285 [Bacteroidetes bacterium GWF2_42_66]HBL77582.1 hypothetical protein [Prolixibacteraceae bacterium]HCB62712.1 hypothetical protein [Bacteroidales bacterium]